MKHTTVASRVESFADMDRETFNSRVREDARTVKEFIRSGKFDNSQSRIGLEYELYGVDGECHLTRLTQSLINQSGFESEVGRHQAELQTRPQPLGRYGLNAQEAELRARLDAALDEMLDEGVRLVSDGLWTISPRENPAREYLLDEVTENGIDLARNVSDDPRYHAQAHSEYRPALRLDAPHVQCTDGTVALNSLGTAIQPHYQLPEASDLATYFRYALRVAAPLLALGVNSPFFPPSFYEHDADLSNVLESCWMENRINVFESVMNPAEGDRSVRFPRDVESAAEAVDRVVEDDTVVPRAVDVGERFDDQFAHFRYKHGTFWRWIRPVFDGRTRAEANARIEFRPLPAQPTIRDSVAFLAAFAGLLEGLTAHEHPLEELSWETAKEDFYAAARNGLDAEIHWIDAKGDLTTHADKRHAELFKYARLGLRSKGLSAEEAERWLSPLRVRASRHLTPARWKHRNVRQRIDDGASLAEAIRVTQRDYVERQTNSLIEGEFTEWSDELAFPPAEPQI